MAIQTINVGNIPNDGTGDDLREAFVKVNNNFSEVDTKLAQVPLSAANRGQSGEGVYAQTVDNVLEFLQKEESKYCHAIDVEAFLICIE